MKVLLLGLLFSFNSFSTNLPGCYYFKEKGIVHFKANSETSYYSCFGYFHGLLHPKEMDLMRRRALGTASEVKGRSELHNDFLMRMLNFEKFSKRLFNSLGPGLRENLSYYSMGVNRGMKESMKKRTVENRDDLQKWRPQHTMALVLLYAWEESKQDFLKKMKEQDLLQRYGKKALRSKGPYKIYNKVKINSSFLDGILSSFNHDTRVFPDLLEHRSFGSPFFSFVMHGENGPLKMIGASIPGIPIVTQGTNNFISWVFRPSFNQVKISFVPSGFETYQIFPTIKIKGGLTSESKSYEVTKKGHPVIPVKGPKDKKALLSWSGLNLNPKDIEGLFTFGEAQNLGELKALADKMPLGQFFALDLEGNTGASLTNKDSAIGIGSESLEDFLRPHFLKRRFLLNPEIKQGKGLGCFYSDQKHKKVFKRLLSFLKRRSASKITFETNWNGEYRNDCKACSFYTEWVKNLRQKNGLSADELVYFNDINSSHVRKSFRKTLKSFKEGIPTWANYKSYYSKKNIKAVFVQNGEQSQFFFTKEGSCSPEKIKSQFDWDEETLHYIRFSTGVE